MTNKIRLTEQTLPPIKDTTRILPRIDPSQVQQALGAEEAPAGLAAALAPLTLFAVREELVSRLQSSGGRPALAGTTRRAKIPLRDDEWEKLEALAAAIAAPGFAPSAGQVASVLLSLSLHAVAAQLASGESSPLTRELQSLTKSG
jgi:hypothetical protein